LCFPSNNIDTVKLIVSLLSSKDGSEISKLSPDWILEGSPAPPTDTGQNEISFPTFVKDICASALNVKDIFS
jgi:hypothetical protein